MWRCYWRMARSAAWPTPRRSPHCQLSPPILLSPPPPARRRGEERWVERPPCDLGEGTVSAHGHRLLYPRFLLKLFGCSDDDAASTSSARELCVCYHSLCFIPVFLSTCPLPMYFLVLLPVRFPACPRF